MDLMTVRRLHIEPEPEPRPDPREGFYRCIGSARVCNQGTGPRRPFDWSPLACPGYSWRADWAVLGVRDGKLFVRFEGGHVQGTEHGTGFRAERAMWISAEAFTEIEIYGASRILKGMKDVSCPDSPLALSEGTIELQGERPPREGSP